MGGHSAVMVNFLDFTRTFQINIYGVPTLATVAIQNEMHAISHCNTDIFSHNYDMYVLLQ